MDPRRDLGQRLLVSLCRRDAYAVARRIREIQPDGAPEQHADTDADARLGRETAVGASPLVFQGKSSQNRTFCE